MDYAYRGRDEKIPNFDFSRDTLEGFTWLQAVEDLKKHLETVPSSEIQWLISDMQSGEWVDGGCLGMGSQCGCILARLAWHVNPDGYYHHTDFFRIYEGLPDRSNTAFQNWLLFVQQGDTPETNPISAAFVEALKNIIRERLIGKLLHLS